MSATVEITETDGEYTAVDTVSRETGTGETRAMALAALAARLRVAEDGVEDAIARARSE